MNHETIGQIVTLLATMDGKYWPAYRDGDELDPDRASYASVLADLTDAVGEQVVRRVLTSFQARPSHKALRDWAVGLAAPPPFRLEAGPVSDSPRLTGPALTRLGAAAPPEVKARMRLLAKSAPPPDTAAEFGLQVRHRQTDVTTRTQPSYTRQRADFIAADRNKKWGHVETTVFRKGDEWPEGAVRVNAEPLTLAQVRAADAERRRAPLAAAQGPETFRAESPAAGSAVASDA